MVTGRIELDRRCNERIVGRERDGDFEAEPGINLSITNLEWYRDGSGTLVLAVSVGPSIVPAHSNRLPSCFGNAD